MQKADARAQRVAIRSSSLGNLLSHRRHNLARSLIIIASQEQPPRRFVAGADPIATAEQRVADLQAQIDAYRDLSTSLAMEEA
jgi:hypothetical protein